MRSLFTSVLLLLLLCSQASAATCAIRCGMESTGPPSQVSAMTHRSSAVSPSGLSQEQVVASTVSQPCDSNLCDADWVFLQNQDVHELSLASLPMDFAGQAVAPIPIASRRQFEANRSTRSIPPFDPLISNLRV